MDIKQHGISAAPHRTAAAWHQTSAYRAERAHHQRVRAQHRAIARLRVSRAAHHLREAGTRQRAAAHGKTRQHRARMHVPSCARADIFAHKRARCARRLSGRRGSSVFILPASASRAARQHRMGARLKHSASGAGRRGGASFRALMATRFSLTIMTSYAAVCARARYRGAGDSTGDIGAPSNAARGSGIISAQRV